MDLSDAAWAASQPDRTAILERIIADHQTHKAEQAIEERQPQNATCPSCNGFGYLEGEQVDDTYYAPEKCANCFGHGFVRKEG